MLCYTFIWITNDGLGCVFAISVLKIQTHYINHHPHIHLLSIDYLKWAVPQMPCELRSSLKFSYSYRWSFETWFIYRIFTFQSRSIDQWLIIEFTQCQYVLCSLEYLFQGTSTSSILNVRSYLTNSLLIWLTRFWFNKWHFPIHEPPIQNSLTWFQPFELLNLGLWDQYKIKVSV